MSPSQLEANRTNAQLSTGPVTSEGKQRSSRNATTHGLTGKIHPATAEESAAYDQHCRAFLEALAPVGLLETELAQEIAEDKWRLKRIRSIESSIFAQAAETAIEKAAANPNSADPTIDAALAKGQAWIERDRSFRLLVTYENRLRRALEKSTAELKALQASRKEAYAAAQQEAVALYLHAKSQGRAYDPTPDFDRPEDHGGFVFSTPAIARLIDRQHRLRAAIK